MQRKKSLTLAVEAVVVAAAEDAVALAATEAVVVETAAKVAAEAVAVLAVDSRGRGHRFSLDLVLNDALVL